ncbi:hypothetical protein [Plantactinospora sp. BC1]|uniref:hypothetical protein n=1 Tax=Plantactinospora sp. BC1 TaxID=2108470 RepID=UPI00131EE07B|nr:hypothetical protein [Plantactinospora sp. BC1]
MSVRRGATWLGTVGLLVGTTVSLAAAPAVAEGESVRVRAPSSISAGGSPASVTVNVSMRGGGCVNVRTVLGVHLPGLTADRVEVRVAADGDWRRVPVSEGANGLVVGERTAPDKPELCARKSVSSRYRVSLAEGAPAGRVTLLAEAYGAGGRLLGRDTDSARLTGRTGDAPATQRTPELVIPSATPQATEEPAAPATEEVAAALPAQPVAAEDESGGSLGLGGMVMVVGIVMVGIGIALMVLLIRRSRAERGRVAVASGDDAEKTARIIVLGAERTTRIPPADPTARNAPVGPVFRSAAGAGRAPGDGAGPVGAAGPLPGTQPVDGVGPVGGVGAAPGGVSAVGDQTLILPASGAVLPRPATSTPPRQPGTLPAQVVPPAGTGSATPGEVPARPETAPARPEGVPPRPEGSVPPEQPPAGGPDATLILPPSQRPQR